MDALFTFSWLVLAMLLTLGGIARGLAGFGVGLIVMPIGILLFTPQTLVPILALVDSPAALILAGGSWRLADRREVAPLALAAVFCLPIGVWLLHVIPADFLVLFVHLFVLSVAIALLCGLRWKTPPNLGRTLCLGGLSGALQSAVGLPGPPIILGWVAANLPGPVLRANIILFFLILCILSLPVLWGAGLFTQPVLILTVSLMPLYLAGILIGRRLFGVVSEEGFRRFVLALVILGAVSGLIVSLGKL